jgi:hypothetical protein
MADIPQVLATYDALVGVALGAGLTFLGSAPSTGATKRRGKIRRQRSVNFSLNGPIQGVAQVLAGSEHE